jgi:hypothetical protein
VAWVGSEPRDEPILRPQLALADSPELVAQSVAGVVGGVKDTVLSDTAHIAGTRRSSLSPSWSGTEPRGPRMMSSFTGRLDRQGVDAALLGSTERVRMHERGRFAVGDDPPSGEGRRLAPWSHGSRS